MAVFTPNESENQQFRKPSQGENLNDYGGSATPNFGIPFAFSGRYYKSGTSNPGGGPYGQPSHVQFAIDNINGVQLYISGYCKLQVDLSYSGDYNTSNTGNIMDVNIQGFPRSCRWKYRFHDSYQSTSAQTKPVATLNTEAGPWSTSWNIFLPIPNNAPQVQGPYSPSNGQTVESTDAPVFTWGFSDPNDVQSGYEIQVEDSAGNIILPPSRRYGDATSAVVSLPTSAKAKNLRWKIRVFDSDQAASAYSPYNAFYYKGSKPQVGFPLSPTGGSSVSSASSGGFVPFSWTFNDPGDFQKSFELQIIDALTSQFITGTSGNTSSTNTSAYIDPSFRGKQLKWRVRVTDNENQISDWSSEQNFKIIGPAPGIPTQISPSSGSTVQYGSGTINFQWQFNESDDTQSAYEIAIRDNASLVQIFTTNKNSGSSGAASPFVDSQYVGKTYAWRVRTWDSEDQVSNWSGWSPFYRAGNPPQVQGPFSPTSNALLDYGTVGDITFSWKFYDPGDSQTAYEVSVEKESGSSVFSSGKVSGSGSSMVLRIPSENRVMPLKWRVRVWDNENVSSDWSSYQTFRVKGNAPAVSGPFSPSNNALVPYGTSGNVNFSWVFVDTVGSDSQQYYQIIVEEVATGTVLLNTQKRFGSNSGVSEQIPASYKAKALRWRVKVWDTEGQESPFSANQTFSISGDPPTVTSPFSPSGGATVLYGSNGSVTFSWKYNDSSGDNQTAYQLIAEDDVTSANILSISKTASATQSVNRNIPIQYVNKTLRWRVRVWDTDNQESPYSSNQTFVLVGALVPTFTSHSNGQLVTISRPTFTWNPGLPPGWTQTKRKIRILQGASVVYDTTLQVDSTNTWQVPASPANIIETNKIYTIELTIEGAQGGNTQQAQTSISITTLSAPTVSNMSPSSAEVLPYGSGAINFTWDFSDPFPGDSQTAYHIIAEINSNGNLVLDTGKRLSVNEFHPSTISNAYKNQLLRWRIQVWDSGNNASGWSANNLFQLADIPVPTINSHTNGQAIASPTPTITWDTGIILPKVQTHRRIRVNQGSTNVHDTGWEESAITSYAIPAGKMLINQNYTIAVSVRQTGGLEGNTSIGLSVQTVAPAAPYGSGYVYIGRYTKNGFIWISWVPSETHGSFSYYKLYRRRVGDETWVELKVWPESTVPIVHKDHYICSGEQYQYSVSQAINQFGELIESDMTIIKTVSVDDEGYWILPDEGYMGLFDRPLPLYSVTGDQHTEEYEQETYSVLGRGRHTEYGDRLGYAGSLSVSLRDKVFTGVASTNLVYNPTLAHRVGSASVPSNWTFSSEGTNGIMSQEFIRLTEPSPSLTEEVFKMSAGGQTTGVNNFIEISTIVPEVYYSAVPANFPIVFSCWLYHEDGSANPGVRLILEAHDAQTGALNSEEYISTVNPVSLEFYTPSPIPSLSPDFGNPAGRWRRVSVSIPNTNWDEEITPGYLRASIRRENRNSSTFLAICAAQIEVSDIASPYFDGNSPGVEWTGEPNNSPSFTNGYHTARQQKKDLEAIRANRSKIYIKNPFGDILKVTAGNIEVTRVPGVGNAEYTDLTIPFTEVAF